MQIWPTAPHYRIFQPIRILLPQILLDATATPQVLSVTPSSGTGATETFVFTYTDPNGHADLDSAQAAIGTSTNVALSCLILFQPASNRVWLADILAADEHR